MAIKKDDSVSEKYKETIAYIKENMKQVGEKDGPKFQMNQEHYNNFMVGKGITPDTIKQVSLAASEYNNASISVLKDLLLEDEKADQAMINTRTHNGVISTRMLRTFHTKTPGTGEAITKHGTVSIKLNQKSRMDKDLLDECARAIEEALN